MTAGADAVTADALTRSSCPGLAGGVGGVGSGRGGETVAYSTCFPCDVASGWRSLKCEDF